MLKIIGPGLIFASSSIGTSHLVLSTRAGAHHGLIFLFVIVGIMLLKYPFYEFGPRYANATGYSLVKGYKDQGKWILWLFMGVILLDMFAVTGAVAAVSAGLLATMFGVQWLSVPLLAGCIIALTVGVLLLGGYKGLDFTIKVISVLLLVFVSIAFVSVLANGPVESEPDFVAPPLLEGAGLTLLISLMGWMPSGVEASTLNSIWNVENEKATGYKPSLKEALFDFNLGYMLTLILAVMFLVIGAFTVYGSGELLEGSTTDFSNKLLNIFTANIGEWAYYIFAIAAFVTIYGTLITVIDAFPRAIIRGIRVLRYEDLQENEEQISFLNRSYKLFVLLAGLGGFCLFYFSTASMIALLEAVTVIAFMISPFIAWLNLRAIQSDAIPISHKPSWGLLVMAYVGLIGITAFAGYYLISLMMGGGIGH
ncbi:MAG: divalent metal cation transporter [Bacteroidota bacterium]